MRPSHFYKHEIQNNVQPRCEEKGENMPSNAYANYTKNIKQVDKLLEAYDASNPYTRGRRSLDHFTRAALIFLCSVWEVYVEEVSRESVDVIISRIDDPKELPKPVKQRLSGKI